MVTHYVDTSALAAIYIPERKSAAVARVLAAVDVAAISPLVEVELVSAVSRRVRAREIGVADGKRILSQYRLHVRDRVYRFFPVTRCEYDLAGSWLAEFHTPLRALDALHLAVVSSNGLTLFTLDAALAVSAAKLGMPVKTV